MTSPRFLLPAALVVSLLAGCAQIASSPPTPIDLAALDLKWEAFEAVPTRGGSGMKRTAIHPAPVTDDPSAVEFWLESGSHLVIAKLSHEFQEATARIPLRSDRLRRYRVDFTQEHRDIRAVVWDITDASVEPTLVATVTATSPSSTSYVRRSNLPNNGVGNEAAPARPAEFSEPPPLLFPTR